MATIEGNANNLIIYQQCCCWVVFPTCVVKTHSWVSSSKAVNSASFSCRRVWHAVGKPHILILSMRNVICSFLWRPPPNPPLETSHIELAMLPQGICHLLLTYLFLLINIYELQNFQRFSKQLFLHEILKMKMYTYRTGMVLRMYRLVFVPSCFLFYILQRWFRNVKAFEKTIEYFHDVYRETSQLQTPPPPPPNEHMTFLVEKMDMWGFPYRDEVIPRLTILPRSQQDHAKILSKILARSCQDLT
jgi:hypothetical protein